MAIIIEEQKSQAGNAMNVALWFGLLVIIAGAAYFLFFASPEIVNYVPPAGFSAAGGVASVSLDPQAVLEDLRFKKLKTYVTIPESTDFGRANPFISIYAGGGVGSTPPRR